MDFLTKDQILAADDLATEEVEVPEWGGKVLVQELGGTDANAYQMSLLTIKDGKVVGMNLDGAPVRLVAMSIVDPTTRRRMFTDAEVEALGRKSAKALDRVNGVAQRLSAVGDDELRETVKNSEATPSEGSS